MIRLFAALLFIQSGVAAAHCLSGMAPGEGLLVEICSAEGIRLIRLDGETSPEPLAQGAFCPVCHGLPGIALPEPPMLSAPAWMDAPVAWHAEGQAHLRPAARAPPYASQAPPATV